MFPVPSNSNQTITLETTPMTISIAERPKDESNTSILTKHYKKLAEWSQKGIITQRAALLESGEYSDMIISCGDHIWNAHKNIICLVSRVLRIALSDSFKEGQEQNYNFKGTDPRTIQAVLHYIYTGDYSDTLQDYQPGGKFSLDKFTNNTPTSTPTSFPPLFFANLHLYTFAHIYEIPTLLPLALSKFARQTNNLWTDSLAFPALLEAISQQADEGYDVSPLLSIAHLVCAKHPDVLLGKEEMRGWLDANGEFGRGVLEETIMLGKFGGGKVALRFCRKCSRKRVVAGGSGGGDRCGVCGGQTTLGESMEGDGDGDGDGDGRKVGKQGER
ncbi:MAG: hypothetical protein M1834_007974 [Cirrosporium novae-zelandiae]|nr:MAG: hypothetical protein M1834_007974 [Cirrosporium novae-zelandiae]